MKHTHGCIMSLRIKSCTGSYDTCEEDIDPETDRCSAPFIHGVCENYDCKITAELDKYKNALFDKDVEISKLKELNTQFRLLCMMPADPGSIQRLLKDGTIDFSGITGLMKNQKVSLDSCEETTVLYLVGYHQKFAEMYSTYAHERISKVQIKEYVATKKAKETKSALDKPRLAAEKEEREKSAKQAKAKTPYGRSLAMYLKHGMSEEDARATLAAMGIKE